MTYSEIYYTFLKEGASGLARLKEAGKILDYTITESDDSIQISVMMPGHIETTLTEMSVGVLKE